MEMRNIHALNQSRRGKIMWHWKEKHEIATTFWLGNEKEEYYMRFEVLTTVYILRSSGMCWYLSSKLQGVTSQTIILAEDYL
jgi:hypothetical protein